MIKKLKEMSLKKKILICIGLAIIILLAWRIYKLIPKTEGRRGLREASVAVEIAPVEKRTIIDKGRFSGSLTPRSQFVVAPKVSGKLKKLYVDIGSSVYNGQLVAEIEDDEYRQQVIQAEADLRVARANLEETKSALELSEKEFERAQTLHQKGIMSDAQLDAVKAQYESQESRYKVASAQVSNKEAALETAKVRLSYTKIQVSWEGGSPIRYVGERFVHEGALLSPNSPIISIVELQPLIAVVFVTEKEYYRLKVGQSVRAYSTVFPEKIFTGRIKRIAPLLSETSRQARIEAEIENPELILKPGIFVNLEVEFNKKENATIVPYKSIIYRGGTQGIFLADLKTKKAYFKPVKTGIIEQDEVEIIEPSQLSGYVITLGQHLLEDGMNIILPQANNSSSEGGNPSSRDKKIAGGRK